MKSGVHVCVYITSRTHYNPFSSLLFHYQFPFRNNPRGGRCPAMKYDFSKLRSISMIEPELRSLGGLQNSNN